MTDFIAAELAVLLYFQVLRARRRAARRKDDDPPGIG